MVTAGAMVNSADAATATETMVRITEATTGVTAATASLPAAGPVMAGLATDGQEMEGPVMAGATAVKAETVATAGAVRIGAITGVEGTAVGETGVVMSDSARAIIATGPVVGRTVADINGPTTCATIGGAGIGIATTIRSTETGGMEEATGGDRAAGTIGVGGLAFMADLTSGGIGRPLPYSRIGAISPGACLTTGITARANTSTAITT